ncbi:hypothetical protein ABT282_07410 [Streptomyces sp. NPDC000927]|uniref:hypothetical protein n=1 Tax=Streptomyces sp. NPDC000927 TaxID=3154371 RepID=UPI0033283D54
MNSTDGIAEIREQIQEGWRVRIIDHDYINDSRDATVDAVTPDGLTLRADRPWSSQGRKFPTMNFTWDGDHTVEGMTVHLWTTPNSTTSRSTKGVRRRVKTFKFTPPKV